MSGFDYYSVPLNPSNNEIRLIDLLPDDPTYPSSPISCQLYTVSLGDHNEPTPPKYTALSYTWGHPLRPTYAPATLTEEEFNLEYPLPPSRILVNSTDVMITGNLHALLQQLRPQSGEPALVLWADAICIDQQNDVEKSHQIHKMKQIFSLASHVYAWLGPEHDGSNELIDFLERISSPLVEISDMLTLDGVIAQAANPDGTLSKTLMREVKKIGPDYPIEAHNALVRRSWWGRTWVFQELCLPRELTFLVGSKRLGSLEFSVTMIFVCFYVTVQRSSVLDRGDYGYGFDGTPFMMIDMRREKKPSSLSDLMRDVYTGSTARNGLHATDPRDKVYGLLGLAKDTEELGIVVDVAKGVEDVYIDAASRLLSLGHFDVLTCAGAQGLYGKYRNLPSWTPDWSKIKFTPWPPLHPSFTACGGTQCDARYITSDGKIRRHVLELSGFEVCCVKEVGTKWEPATADFHFDHPAAETFVADIERFCRESNATNANIYSTPQQRVEAAWRIACFDIESSWSGWHMWRAPRNSDCLAFQGFTRLKEIFRDRDSPKSNDETVQCFISVMAALHWVRPFKSEEGYVGLVPADTREGDLLYIFNGAKVPYVTRKVCEGFQSLIGAAYVHGVMDGEFVAKDTTPNAEVIRLC